MWRRSRVQTDLVALSVSTVGQVGCRSEVLRAGNADPRLGLRNPSSGECVKAFPALTSQEAVASVAVLGDSLLVEIRDFTTS